MIHRKTYLDYLLIGIVLLLAAALRLYDIGSIPLFNDELSALNRLRFDSLGELIEKGIKPDGHPAGVQIFLYYWTAWVGTGSIAVRLPFIILGLLSIVLAYEIGQRWFNATTGLWLAIWLAVLQYPIYFTSIARPYASGLFFCLATVWCWTLFSLNQKRIRPGIWVIYVLAATACAYNHYFSMLFAAMVGITGLFTIPHQKRIRYLVANAAVLVLYLPHVSVFRAQIQTGGIGGWLAPPGGDFLIRYFNYILHFSPLMWAVFVVAGAIGLMLHIRGNKQAAKFRRISLIWFLIPLVIGGAYSIWIAPVLHQGVLFFSFPFLILFLFSFYPELPFRQRSLLLIFAAIGVFSLLYDRDHHSIVRNRGVEMIAEKSRQFSNETDDKGYTAAFNVNHPYYVQYYYQQWGDSLPTLGYQLQSPRQFRDLLSQQTNENFSLGWCSRETPLEYLGIIREQYPHLIHAQTAFVSEFYAFSRFANPDSSQNIFTYHSHNDFSLSTAFWENGNGIAIRDSLIANNSFWQLDSSATYGPTFMRSTEDLFVDTQNILLVSLKARKRASTTQPQLVVSIAADTGVVMWKGKPLEMSSTDWSYTHFAMRMRDISLQKAGLKLSVYIWNPDKGRVWIDDFEVIVIPGNPYLYAMAEPIARRR